jgi:hypothetical protein
MKKSVTEDVFLTSAGLGASEIGNETRGAKRFHDAMRFGRDFRKFDDVRIENRTAWPTVDGLNRFHFIAPRSDLASQLVAI